MRKLRGSHVATEFGLRLWEEWRKGRKLSLAALAVRSDYLSASTLGRILKRQPTDRIIQFYKLAGIEPTLDVHYRQSATDNPISIATSPNLQVAAERFDSLTSDEKVLAAALTIFSEGCTSASAQEIVGDQWSQHSELVRKGILESTDGRFYIKRKYLSVSASEARRRKVMSLLRPRHASYFSKCLAKYGEMLNGAGEREAVLWFSREHSNAFAATTFLFGEDANFAKDVAGVLGVFYFRAELYEEGISALSWIFDHWNDPADLRYVRCLGSRAKCWSRLLDYRNARVELRRALRAARTIDEPIVQIECRSLLAGMPHRPTMRRLDPRLRATGRAHHSRIQALLAQHKLPAIYHARAHFNYALCEMDSELSEIVFERCELACKFALESKNEAMIATCLTLHAELSHRAGNYQEAVPKYLEALEACRRGGSSLRLYAAHLNFGELYLESGEFEQAVEQFDEAAKTSYAIQNVYYPVIIAFLTSLAHGLKGDRERAEQCFREGAAQAAMHDFAHALEPERYLPAAAILAQDYRVREDAYVAFVRSEHRWVPPSMRARDELVRAAAGISQDAHGRGESLFDGLTYSRLLGDLGWLSHNGYEVLRELRVE